MARSCRGKQAKIGCRAGEKPHFEAFCPDVTIMSPPQPITPLIINNMMGISSKLLIYHKRAGLGLIPKIEVAVFSMTCWVRFDVFYVSSVSGSFLACRTPGRQRVEFGS
jgi:hypothetical protein